MGLPTLSRALVLEAPDRVPDGAGGFINTWVALGTVWAEISTQSGRLTQEAETPVAAVTLRIVVRAAPSGSSRRPCAGQRFREGTRLYAIESVSEKDLAGRYLICFAKEEVAP